MLIGSTVTAPTTRRLTRAQTHQASKVAQAEAKLLLAKGDFQALLLQLFLQRRFQHVLIASAFYRSVFDDGELPIKTEGKIAETLDHAGMPLTVSTLESLTREAILEVRQGVAAVGNMVASKGIQGAEKRLLETYFLGEHLPEMHAFPTENRKAILVFRQNRKEVLKALEVKDYTRASEKNTQLMTLADDYDPAPVASVISSASLESDFHLAKARNAATAGNRETMEKEVKAAAAIWPQNPELKGGAGEMMEQFNLQAKHTAELDQLLEKGELRQIEAKREIFAATVAHDETRQSRLREALSQLLEIGKALEKARELDEMGSPAQAWVVIEVELTRHPHDPKLLKALADYGGRAPEFVRYLLGARRSGDNPAFAMNQSLLALQENPACEEAHRILVQLAKRQLEAL